MLLGVLDILCILDVLDVLVSIDSFLLIFACTLLFKYNLIKSSIDGIIFSNCVSISFQFKFSCGSRNKINLSGFCDIENCSSKFSSIISGLISSRCTVIT